MISRIKMDGYFKQFSFKNMIYFITPSLMVSASLFVSCGNKPTGQSSVTTVDIPQTPVRNQQSTGFCWAYASAGMIESWSLKSGNTLNISEEALAFYRMAEELLYVSNDAVLRNKIIDASVISTALINEVFVEGLQGGEALYTNSLPGKQRTLSGLEIFEKYGAWPEEAWPVKITNSRPVIFGIAERFKVLLEETRSDNQNHTMQQLLDRVMVSPQGSPGTGYVSVPPANFQNQGRATNSKAFWQSLNFDISRFEPVALSQDPVQFNQTIQRIKQALAGGLTVPLELPVVDSHLRGSDFKVIAGEPFEVSGFSGHVVVITDWVNVGGRPGAVSPDELASSLNAVPELFNYFVIKNSWGTGSENGLSIPRGYYSVYRDYFEQAAASPAVVNQPGFLYVVLPKVGSQG